MGSHRLTSARSLSLAAALLASCAGTASIDPQPTPAFRPSGSTAPPIDRTLVTAAPSPCPDDMVTIDGQFCPAVIQECLRWIDKGHMNKSGVVDPNMCEKFRYPSRCVSPLTMAMRFCIDRYEWPDVAGAVPQTRMSWVEAKSDCEAAGKRLCTDQEWTFACEGPGIKPYPYGDGYHRDAKACNADLVPWVNPWTSSFARLDRRSPSGAHPGCRSDFGAYDLVGNVDEWVLSPSGHMHRAPWLSGLKGGHWVRGIQNQCRYMTDSHEPAFSFYVTGTRCWVPTRTMPARPC